MVSIEPVTVNSIEKFKAVRLRALKESPEAFGSTYAREVAFTEDEWIARATRWNGEEGIGYVAIDNGEPCGIAGALLEEDDALTAHLVSMWTAPSHRGRGVGRMLVEQVIAWAHCIGVKTLLLTVVSSNDAAIDFYKGLGFAMTGRTEPYPNDAKLFEYEMGLALSNG
jgi:GNAT superfamily N-acetyltransferase